MMEPLPLLSSHNPNSGFETFGRMDLTLSHESGIVGRIDLRKTTRDNDVQLLADIDTPASGLSSGSCPVSQESGSSPTQDRSDLIQEAILRGVPLIKIEEYLDWLDAQ